MSDVVGYSRLAGADEDRTLARLRALRSDLIDPTIAVHHGRVVKRTGDGGSRRVPQRGRCRALRHRGAERHGRAQRWLPPERRIEFRIGIHLGDVVEESDGDLMGDGVNIAARLEGIAGRMASVSPRTPIAKSRARLELAVTDLGEKQLKNIAGRCGFIRCKSASPAQARPHRARSRRNSAPPRLSIVVLPFANLGGDPEQEYFVDGVTESLTTDLSRISGSFVIARNTAFTYKGKARRLEADRARVERPLCLGGQRSALRQPDARQRPAHRCGNWRASLGRAFR